MDFIVLLPVIIVSIALSRTVDAFFNEGKSLQKIKSTAQNTDMKYAHDESSSEEISSNQETYSVDKGTLTTITNNTGYDCDIIFTKHNVPNSLVTEHDAVTTITLKPNQSMDATQIRGNEYLVLIQISTNTEFHRNAINITDIIKSQKLI
jgi:hypothetical protein